MKTNVLVTFLTKTQYGEGLNRSIFRAVAPLERPHGIEIFEKSREFRDPQNPRKSKNPKILDFGPKSMKIGFDRLCQGPKIDFLPFGTSKNPQNPENPRKNPENPENPDFWSLVPHSYPLRGGSMVKKRSPTSLPTSSYGGRFFITSIVELWIVCR